MPKTNQKTENRPVVLCFSGHDPSGGAGIQADIEAIAANSAHAATVITALTVQNSSNIQSIQTSQPEYILNAARLIAADMPVACIKIGLIGGREQAEAIRAFLLEHRNIPVVLDPVLAAGGGHEAATTELVDFIQQQLVPLCHIITPNIPEAFRLSGSENIDDAAQQLLKLGASYALVTGTHGDSEDVIHQLLGNETSMQLEYPRLDASYHGSGCTLASAIAANIARNMTTEVAVKQALDYTWQTLQQADQPGKGQHIPRRVIPVS